MNALKIGLVAFVMFAGCSMTSPARHMAPGGCDSVADCDDGDADSVDTCMVAARSCHHTRTEVLPSGCSSNAECDDGLAESQDICMVNGTCRSTIVERPAPPPPPPAPDAGPVPEEDAGSDAGDPDAGCTADDLSYFWADGSGDHSPERPSGRLGDTDVTAGEVQLEASCAGFTLIGVDIAHDMDVDSTGDTPADIFSHLRVEVDGSPFGGTFPELHDMEEYGYGISGTVRLTPHFPLRIRIVVNVKNEHTLSSLDDVNMDGDGPFRIQTLILLNEDGEPWFYSAAGRLQRMYLDESPRSPDFGFCDELGPSYPSAEWGYIGCCTNTAFIEGRTTGPVTIPTQTLIKGSLSRVYYWAADGRRYVFPNADTLASWFHDPRARTLRDDGLYVCGQVIQIPDADLAAISIGGNVTFRPGSVVTGIASDPTRYVVTQGAVLRRFVGGTIPAGMEIYPPRTDVTHLLPDAFFINYFLGADILGPGEYDAAREYDTTIAEEIERVRAAH